MATLTKDEALDLAIEVWETRRFLPGSDYDWQKDVIALVESNTFTTAQAASIAGRNKQYVVRTVREHFADVRDGDYSPRAYGGVSGRFNPDSLSKIKYLRDRWVSTHRPGRRIDDVTRRYLTELIEEGNGISLLAHLTEISRNTIEAVRKDAARRDAAAS